MRFGIVLYILNVVTFVSGCKPVITHDQSQYCAARYVFTGVVRHSHETDDESEFEIQLTSNIKDRIGFPETHITVYGEGRSSSCGPTRLNHNQEYILYVSEYILSTNRPKAYISQQYKPTVTNLNRMRRYDCSCKIEIDFPRPFPNSVHVTPAEDKCVVTEREYNCNLLHGFCARRYRIYGTQACQWIAPKKVCPS